ncbi:unnamed protein product, partial [Trichobilharzia szidati]
MVNHTVNETCTNYFEHASDVEDNINTLTSTHTNITENNRSIVLSSTSDTLMAPPLPPHHFGHSKSLSSSSITSTPGAGGGGGGVGVDSMNIKRCHDTTRFRIDCKEASQVITSAIDAQVKSISEMLSYFSKLVKAEKTVQQALSDLLNDQKEATGDPSGGGGGQRQNGGGGAGGSMRNFFRGNSRRRGRNTLSGWNKNLSNGTTDGELSKLLHNLVISTNHQARMYSTRALFHKLITAGQLDSLNACEQCLKRTYMECEEELKSQARQYTLSLKAYEKKYMKYTGQLSNLQSKLTNLCDKRLTNNRRVVDGLMNNLEYSTKKLNLLHNEYCLALLTANHYQQWLHTHLRPCLLKGVERTMQLASEVVWHLLVFGGENIHHFQTNWLKEFQSELSLSNLLEQNGVQFPGPVNHSFNPSLSHPSISGNISPGSLIVNDLTGQSLIELAQLHKNKELLHRETVSQMTKECLQWEEALSQWRAVFANPGPNPWSNSGTIQHSLTATTTRTSTASSLVNSSIDDASNGFTMDNPIPLTLPDIQDLWHDDRARPVNLCEVSFRLAICEFELCFATCLADSEAQLVSVLTDAQCRLNWYSLKLLSDSTTSSTTSTFLRNHTTDNFNGSSGSGDDNNNNNNNNGHNNYNHDHNNNDIDIQNGNDGDTCGQLLNNHDNSTPVCGFSDSSGSIYPKLLIDQTFTPPTPPPALSTSNTSDLSSSMEQQQQQQQRPERNRLWQSVRQSMSKFRSHFIRNNYIRSSTSALLNSRTSYQQRMRETLIAIPIAENGHKYDDNNNNNNNNNHDSHQTFNTLLHIQSPSYGKSSSPYPMNSVNNMSSECQRRLGTDTPSYHQNRRFSHQNIQTNRESQDSTSILTSFPLVIESDVDINKEPWFHGVLPRAEVERLLQNQGDFLVRQTSKRASGRDTLTTWNGGGGAGGSDVFNGGGSHHDGTLNKDIHSNATVLRMVLSVYWHGHRHFILYGGGSSGEGWHLEDGYFSTIRELVEYHMKTQTPVTAKSGACLITPISRPDWELDNRDVQLLQKIGQGNFGDVYRGVYNGCEVAVKTCRVDMTASDLRQKFLQGETTALNFNHPNIVKLVGIAVQSYPIMIVMEYVPGGSLLNHLRKSKNALPVMKLLKMSLDAASGMSYLEMKNCIHRDLAARNCLITDDGQLKIADFGMSREEHIYELSDKRGQIPIKWTAPEALRTGRYTIKCDVWSYGVLLWEIFTFGDIPYRNWSNQQTRDMIESGYRLPAPDLMPLWLRTLMNRCWSEEPEKRPSFADISSEIKLPNANSFTPNLRRSADNHQQNKSTDNNNNHTTTNNNSSIDSNSN